MSETKLPAGWLETAASDGGVDLHLSTSGRPFLVVGAAALLVFTAWNAISRWAVLSSSAAEVRFAIITVLTLFVLWCAFGDEVWHIDHNRVEHRIGLGPMRFKRCIQDAELQIIERSGTNFSTPYYRLYAVMEGKQQFLFQRKLEELEQLSRLISSHTGWHIRQPFFHPI
jgi:hypothetical protein